MNPSRLLLASACLLSSALAAHAKNPLNFGSKILTADPSGHVWADGRMYLYTSHDEECQKDFWMKDWHVFSSSDLINWRDHGAVLSVSDLAWADNYAWAPDCAYKNGKYYFCFPAGTGHKDRIHPEKSTKWMGIGIAESDSPTGPFKDVIGAPLWREPYANDPCLFVDDDGRAYVYFHGGGDWMVREMADDMRSVKGNFIRMDMGGYEPKMEGPWVFKRQGIYYFTMPENNRKLTYYMSKSPTGPWKYQGVFMEQEGENNNHHSIVEFKGQWILFYHRWLNTDSACNRPQRHVCAEYLFFNEDGTIQEVKRTEAGVSVPPAKPGPSLAVGAGAVAAESSSTLRGTPEAAARAKEIGTKHKDDYDFLDKDGRSIPLPGGPYLALREQRLAFETVSLTAAPLNVDHASSRTPSTFRPSLKLFLHP